MKCRFFQLLTLCTIEQSRTALRYLDVTHVLELVTSPDFVLTAIVVPETFLTAAQPQILIDDSLAGQLLIASPTIRDPRFDHAVILVVRHNHDGAMGIVINMPTDERPLANILEMVGEKDTNVTGKVQLFAGGPVQPELGLLIHSSDYRGPGTIDVNELNREKLWESAYARRARDL